MVRRKVPKSHYKENSGWYKRSKKDKITHHYNQLSLPMIDVSIEFVRQEASVTVDKSARKPPLHNQSISAAFIATVDIVDRRH